MRTKDYADTYHTRMRERRDSRDSGVQKIL